MENVDVKEPMTMESVPFDGLTIGEGMFRGNMVTRGYHKNPKATKAALRGGWFHTGDFAMRHPDGNIEVKDLEVDMIISGDKKISSVDVEAVLFCHPALFEVAVIGLLSEQGCNASSEEINKFYGDKLSEYMVPKTLLFDDLPITSTGKTKKAVLRERAKSLI
ncbi:hypothetical protein CRYUN_Cryun18bG0126800 [Craigia yunnanensis]